MSKIRYNIGLNPQHDTDFYELPADRSTVWQPGVTYNGGIPTGRTQHGSTITSTGNTTDRRATIQTALDACPGGSYVLLGPGDFSIAGNTGLVISTNDVTLRGSGTYADLGASGTRLVKTGSTASSGGGGGNAGPAVTITKANSLNLDGVTTAFAASIVLINDGVKGSYSITVASASGFSVGDLVRIDELSNAVWKDDPRLSGSQEVWASSDYLVTWNKHNPVIAFIDDFDAATYPSDPTHWYTAYTVPDRPICEMKKISAISGTTITFSTPLHIAYRTANTAKMSKYNGSVISGASVEDLTAYGFDLGSFPIKLADKCWVRNCEADFWFDKPFNFLAAFQCEARECYQHGTPWPSNSAENYAFILNWASADCLIENCISVMCDKVTAARAAGAGCVFGYNYLDMGFIGLGGQDAWCEVGANASHLTGPHHVLFEGNWAFNADSDYTHGNSCHITHFRNHYKGFRAPYVWNGISYDDYNGNGVGATEHFSGPLRCAGNNGFGYWHSFVGNVLGASGQMSGWAYQGDTIFDGYSVWLMGWDPSQQTNADANVITSSFAGATLRDGNYDYLTGTVRWHGIGGAVGDGTPKTLRDSLYLSGKPSWWGSGTWPWVDAIGTTKLYSLPAKDRFDAY